MVKVAVVIPTYFRHYRIQAVYDNLHNYPGAKVRFVVHASDNESKRLVRALGLQPIIDWQAPSGVNATNQGFQSTMTEWTVIGQDDIHFHPGWLEEAMRVATETGAKVIGLNDGYGSHAPSQHSVAWLVHRPYVEEHGLAPGYPNHIFCPEYTKNYADNELNEVAKSRKVWAYAEDSLAEHLHPGFGKATNDETYTRPEQQYSADAATFARRRPLW